MAWAQSKKFDTLPTAVQHAIQHWQSYPTGYHPTSAERLKLLAQVQAIAQAWGGECLSDTYLGIQGHLLFACQHGHVWGRTPATLLAGNFCPECGSRQAVTLKRLKDWARRRGWLCLSDVFVDQATPMSWQCDKGHRWQSNSKNIKACKGCPECYRAERYHSLATMQRVAIERGGKCWSISYANVDTKMIWECHRGHFWIAPPMRVLSGSWCPLCARLDRIYRPGSTARYKYTSSQRGL